MVVRVILTVAKSGSIGNTDSGGGSSSIGNTNRSEVNMQWMMEMTILYNP